MQFISNHRNYKLTVVPADYEWIRGGTRKLIRGLRVEFVNGAYDTDAAAKQNGWSQEDKEAVEEALLQNPDFGTRNGYYLSDVVPEYATPEPVGVPLDDEDVLATVDAMCAVTFQTPDGAVPCGNKAVTGSDYCRQHQRVAEKVGS